jgi:hypothetical protein
MQKTVASGTSAGALGHSPRVGAVSDIVITEPHRQVRVRAEGGEPGVEGLRLVAQARPMTRRTPPRWTGYSSNTAAAKYSSGVR